MREQKAKTTDRSHAPWGKLANLCKQIHVRWHVKKNRTAAKPLIIHLEEVLLQVPENESAIVREEGLALLNELKGDTPAAIKHRRREIQLVEELHASVKKSVAASDYDACMGKSILVGCDEAFLQERRAILRTLQNELTATERPKRRVS